MEGKNWAGVLVPTGTPSAIVTLLNRAGRASAVATPPAPRDQLLAGNHADRCKLDEQQYLLDLAALELLPHRRCPSARCPSSGTTLSAAGFTIRSTRAASSLRACRFT